ncbi:FMN-linked oxidoreductase [Fistulina hepatica ATCC 64428]|uniref:FMN-linked oxidoreductase n=1 Tax=Fistulina hepatica ATCC 64428 TaxID=1128425 RepID=A0A0D7A1W7_9AGAR|nr:FMN-linked oxidoreductase [Fistulina hepatica ATCC 64428]
MCAASALFKPVSVGPLTLRNRVFMSALTRNRSFPDAIPNRVNVEYYKQRAAGGAALIVTEGVLITPQGTEWPDAPGIWSKEQIAAWKPVIDAVHAEGASIYIQLWHLGRVSHPDLPWQKKAGVPVYAPSAIAAKGGQFRQLPGAPGYVTPTEIDDPVKLIALYKQAAINAKEAGFDGVELHGANGYLVHQFLDSTSNLRTDKWGGSVENRSRFGLEVLRELITVWGADRVAIKLSPAGGYNDLGMPLEETLATFKYFVAEANKLDLAYIALVRHSVVMDPAGRGTAHDVIASYGPLITAPTKRFGNAGYTPEEAEKAVSAGDVDGVFFGFLYVGNPDLAKRIQNGKDVNFNVDMNGLYNHESTPESARKGYSDYPPAEY